MTNKGNVLVTGGAGYIGSHAAWALKNAGYTPVVVDSLVMGNAWAAGKFGPFEQGDVGDVNFIRDVCQKYGPAAVMHFAAFIEVPESVKNPQKYFENNRDKAIRFFDTVQACGVRNIVFSGTAAAYGNVTSSTPITESVPAAPINPYGQAKVEAEKHLRKIDMQSVILRYFNVAGAAPKDVGIGEAHYGESHLIPRVLLPAMKPKDSPLLNALGLGGTVKIFGTDYATRDGTCVRDYVHVVDLVDAHIKALEYLQRGGASNLFNLGSKTGYTVREIIKESEKVLGKTIPVIEEARRAGDPDSLIADSGKAKDILGWEAKHSLSDIIASARDWHSTKLYEDTILERAAQAR